MRGRGHPLCGTNVSLYKTLSLELNGRLVVKRKKPVPEGPAQTMALPQTVAAFRVQALEGRSLYPKGLRRRWPYRKPLRPFGYRLLKEEACTRKKPVPEGPAQTMALPQTVAAFRVQALERSRFAVGRLPAAYGDWSARPLACRSEGNGVRWVWNCLAELTTRVVSALRPSIAVARGDRATVGTRDFPSSPPMGDSFWLGL